MKRIAIVGYGYWGPNLLRNFAKTDNCEIAYCCDLKSERLSEVNKVYPAIKITDKYEELLRDNRLDAIVIATPTEHHFGLARKALLADKDVLIEKPMTRTLKEANDLVRIAKRRKRIIMVDHVFMFNPAVRKVKELIDGGEIGDILYIDSVRANLGLFQEKVNAIYDLATHDFSIIQYLLNKKPKAVQAFGVSHYSSHNKQEDVCYITVEYPKNVFAHIHVSWLSPLKVRKTTVVGTKKMIVYDEVDPAEKVRVYDKGVEVKKTKEVREVQIGYRSGDVWIPQISADEALGTLAGEFIEAIKKRKAHESNGELGASIIKLLEKSNDAMRFKKRIIL